MKHTTPSAVFALAVVVASCSAAPEPLNWQSLPDGSSVAFSDAKAALGPAEVVRCWPTSGAFDCLTLDGRSLWRDVFRFRAKSLPVAWSDEQRVGYGCSVGSSLDGYQEHIYGPQGPLTDHVATSFTGDFEPGWRKDYVEQYAAKNGLQATADWFDCRALTLVLNKGSNATLGTTDVSADLLDGRS